MAEKLQLFTQVLAERLLLQDFKGKKKTVVVLGMGSNDGRNNMCSQRIIRIYGAMVAYLDSRSEDYILSVCVV